MRRLLLSDRGIGRRCRLFAIDVNGVGVGINVVMVCAGCAESGRWLNSRQMRRLLLSDRGIGRRCRLFAIDVNGVGVGINVVMVCAGCAGAGWYLGIGINGVTRLGRG